ncbi:MAG: glycosyltransferase family 4 protein [Anaerolineales bacterium]|nr:glycosyltransferase family 4 protein [Anaerolineales bacterium]MCB8938044.1 glycosyltransferase family 4 protein [Ardenticatenaceae bacterium]
MPSSQSAMGEVEMAAKGKTKAVDVERPLRILMIAPTSFFSDYGGHIRILEEAYTLQGMRHQVAIVTYYKGSDMPDLDIRRTAPLPWRPEYEVGSSRHKIAFDVYLAWQSLVEALRFKPDVIHGHMHEGALIGGVLAKLLRRPLVFDFQGSMTAEMTDHNFLRKNGRLYRLAFRLENLINKLPDAILTSSIKATCLLENEFRIASHKLVPLPDCANDRRFDPDKFSPEMKQELRQKLGLPNGRTIIAYLGLLTDYQGVPHLIESAARLKQAGENCHFLIMGYPNVPRYQQMARDLGAEDVITFTGKVMYQHAPAYLSLGDIAVAPKMSSSEGSGKLLNYMALGQPVVAYDSAVHREYLADLGVYAPSGDVAAFTEAITTLLHQPERRQALGHQLRQRALQVYSWQKAGERIVALYKQLTK